MVGRRGIVARALRDRSPTRGQGRRAQRRASRWLTLPCGWGWWMTSQASGPARASGRERLDRTAGRRPGVRSGRGRGAGRSPASVPRRRARVAAGTHRVMRTSAAGRSHSPKGRLDSARVIHVSLGVVIEHSLPIPWLVGYANRESEYVRRRRHHRGHGARRHACGAVASRPADRRRCRVLCEPIARRWMPAFPSWAPRAAEAQRRRPHGTASIPPSQSLDRLGDMKYPGGRARP